MIKRSGSSPLLPLSEGLPTPGPSTLAGTSRGFLVSRHDDLRWPGRPGGPQRRRRRPAGGTRRARSRRGARRARGDRDSLRPEGKELDDRPGPDGLPPWRQGYPYDAKLGRRDYERTKRRLQIELLKLQAHVKDTGQKVAVVFEGRDAAGKGGAIKRFTEHLNPRGARVVALTVPSPQEESQWYFHRYVGHLPSAARWCCSTGPGTTEPAWSG